MTPDDPLAPLKAIPGELSGTRTVAESLLREVMRSRRLIRWLTVAVAVVAVVALVAVEWTAHQQTVINRQQAALTRLADQNRDREAIDARNAHDLCLKLRQSRAEILPVWKHVLSERPGDAALLPRVEAAVPLGTCPKE